MKKLGNQIVLHAMKLNNDIKSAMRGELPAQGMVEYALILILIAFVVVLAMFFLGPWIGNVLSNINCSLGAACKSAPRPTPVIY